MFYSAKDLMAILNVGESRAYAIIRKLNEELVDKGYIIPKRGQVLRSYADKRLGLKQIIAHRVFGFKLKMKKRLTNLLTVLSKSGKIKMSREIETE